MNDTAKRKKSGNFGGSLQKAYENIFYLRLIFDKFNNDTHRLSRAIGDLPFLFSADDIFLYRIRDGCTSQVKAFIALCRAFDLPDVRMVYAVANHYYNLGCGCMNPPLTSTTPVERGWLQYRNDMVLNGHQFALVRIPVKGLWKWYLVDVRYYKKGKKGHRYSIIPMTSKMQNIMDPRELTGLQLVDLPGFKEGPAFYDNLTIVAVGKNNDDDLGVDTLDKAMNLTVSGSVKSSSCRWGCLPE